MVRCRAGVGVAFLLHFGDWDDAGDAVCAGAGTVGGVYSAGTRAAGLGLRGERVRWIKTVLNGSAPEQIPEGARTCPTRNFFVTMANRAVLPPGVNYLRCAHSLPVLPWGRGMHRRKYSRGGWIQAASKAVPRVQLAILLRGIYE